MFNYFKTKKKNKGIPRNFFYLQRKYYLIKIIGTFNMPNKFPIGRKEQYQNFLSIVFSNKHVIGIT